MIPFRLPRSSAAEVSRIVSRGGTSAGVMSDVTSKPIFIAAENRWRDSSRAMNIDLAMRINGKGEVYLTTLMAKRLSFDDKNTVMHEVP